MFMTNHKTADYHALLRSFSNAPLYITDTDKPDLAILSKLGGWGPDGQYRLVQATNGKAVKLPGRAFEDVVSDGIGPALVIGVPAEHSGGAIVGAWNCRSSGNKTLDVLTSKDIGEALALGDDAYSPGEYAVVQRGGSTFSIVNLPKAEHINASTSEVLFSLCIDEGTCTTHSITPIVDSSIGRIAILGLKDKYAGLCAVSQISLEDKAPVAVPTIESKQLAQAVNAPTGPVEVPSERTSLLPRSPAPAPTPTLGLHNRLWALLLFWRRDLRALRASLLRDFWSSPVSTLFRELRAVFGGPSTVTALAEAVSRTPSIRSPETSIPPMETSVGPADGAQASQLSSVSVEVIATGKLALVLLGGKPEEYIFRLGGDVIDKAAVEWSGEMVTLDLDKAIKTCSYDRAAKMFCITISRQ